MLKLIGGALGGLVLGAAIMFLWSTRSSAPDAIVTPYQAVLLDSGAAFFGQLENTKSPLGSESLVLTDVYYVQSQTNPETKQTTNILVKRGKEWHAPDRMIINRRHVIFVEPVSPNSTVANLISNLKKQ